MKTRMVQARLPEDLADWFDEEFPRGAMSKQYFIEGCFRALREIVDRSVAFREQKQIPDISTAMFVAKEL